MSLQGLNVAGIPSRLNSSQRRRYRRSEAEGTSITREGRRDTYTEQICPEVT